MKNVCMISAVLLITFGQAQASERCQGFSKCYEQGVKAINTGNAEAALNYFKKAEAQASNSTRHAAALSGLVMPYLQKGDFCQAKESLSKAKEILQGERPDFYLFSEQVYNQARSTTLLTAEQISCSLKHSATRSMRNLSRVKAEGCDQENRAINVVKRCESLQLLPKIDITINFDTNKYQLSSLGRLQVKELGKALSNDSFRNLSFKLVGHTDVRGAADHNQWLSEKRAEHVQYVLEKKFPQLAKKLMSSGRGEMSPLTDGTTETDHKVNRRVTVSLYK